MDNSIYITLSRQLALFRDMDVTAGNIANMTTAGYNANHVTFSSYLVEDGKRGDMAFAHDINEWRDTSPGSTHITGNPLDLAIGGEGYFVVETPLGNRYTRAGSFQIDPEGRLVTQENYPVLDPNGQPLLFNETDKEITVGSLGNIKVDGEERGTVGVVTFANPQLLERVGDRFYASAAEPEEALEPRVMQGVLESSNVQPVVEITHMIEVSRAVGSTAKFIETMYEMQRRSNDAWTRQG